MKTVYAITTISLFSLISSAFADDVAAKAKLEQAKKLYEERAEPSKVEATLPLLETASQEAQSALLKYDILTLWSMTLYFKGMHAEGRTNKMAVFEDGRVKAQLAKGIDDNRCEAYYWYAANLGRWGEANGILASLFKKQELIDHLEAIYERVTVDGLSGEVYEGFGADRILGRIYFKLPGFAGGSLPKSLKYLERAFSKVPQYALTVIYYAEALDSNGERERAKRILDELLQKDPNTLLPGRVPETIEEFELAKALRAELGT